MVIQDRAFFSINGRDVEKLLEAQVKKFRYGDLIFSSEEEESITIEVFIGSKRKKKEFKAYNLFLD